MPSLLASLGLNVSPFKAGIMGAVSDAKHAGKEIKEAFGEAIGEKLGELGSAAFVEESIRRTVEFGEKVFDLASRLGISTDAVQRWDFALKMNGSSIDKAAGFFEKLAIARQKAEAGVETSINHV